MDMRRLGNCGLTVSVVGLGGNNLGRAGTVTETADGAAVVVYAAVDAGITLFDTADCYGQIPGLSEELLGAALGTRREDVVVATKFGMDWVAPMVPTAARGGHAGTSSAPLRLP
jgi:1-deoxyxylulose-5-phosphate synthase